MHIARALALATLLALAGGSAAQTELKDVTAIEHMIRVNDRILSGGEPKGDAAFDALAKLGVKTIISVDSARPDIKAAKARGMRYIHIPIGYDGIPADARAKIARALRDTEGPVFFHCHHGQHRGPAAAAIGARCMGSAPEVGEELMRLAGTSPDYEGLFRDVRAFDPKSVEGQNPELVEIAALGTFKEAMANVDRVWDRLKLVDKADWKAPAKHPDVSPQQETLLLAQGLRESHRLLAPKQEKAFGKELKASEDLAWALHDSLKAADIEATRARFKAVGKSCKDCHKAHRD
jgi:protein tyrosine phosphatase (PTP) superfamily phosphohydrolase (DUF442 family)